MAQVKGIYTSGTESRKKKNQTTPVQTAPVVTPKPVKPATVNVPAQTINDARAEQQREQQYRVQQSKPAVVPPVKPATVNVPAQTTNAARQEQLAARQYDQVKRELTADPQELDRISAAKARAERNWENWLWDTGYSPNSPIGLEDFYREAGIALPRGSISNRDIPTAQQLYEAEQRGRAEELSVSAARKEQQARRERELEALYEQIDRAWYSDDPDWQAAHRDTDAARAEQRSAREHQEQREREQKAYDLSTQAEINEKFAVRKSLAGGENPGYTETGQEKKARDFWERIRNSVEHRSPEQEYLELLAAKKAEKQQKFVNDLSTQGAMNEKLAERRYWNDLAAKAYEKEKMTAVGSGALYNEHTGEIFLPAKNGNETSGWKTYSLNGKVLVDPEVERRFGVLSNGISAVLTGTGAVVTKKPTVMMLQPIMATLVKAGLLEKKYEGKEFVLNNSHTNEVGITVSGAFGVRASGSIGIAADCYGNIGIVLSGSPLQGGGTPSASAAVYSTRTNAPQIDLLSGKSVQIGGAVGPIGIDVVGFCNPNSGEAYYGISTNVGVSLVSADLHASIEHSTIINMKNLFEQLNGM